ncbi:MAG: hypothetical protein AAFX44_19910 [Pseudomonadota bacterium]
MAAHRARTGRIDYLAYAAGSGESDFWGFEEWRMTEHADGSRIMRAYCELNDEPPLIRDVVHSVDAAFHPIDTYVRLTKANRINGVGWFRFSDTDAVMDGRDESGADVHDRTEISRAMRGFGSHNLTSDAWLAARYDFTQGPGVQRFLGNLMTSIDHRGATGPAFARTNSSLAYGGIETVAVPAGTFACHRFAISGTSHDHPPYDFWVTTDGDYLYVKGVVAEPYRWLFELTSLTGGAD